MGQDGPDCTVGPERPALSDWASALSWGVDESRLVTELQAGSETAFDWLVTHYHGPVYNLILSMLGDVADAADGTQEVFLKAFRGIRSFRQGSSLKTWLYRIAIREALNHKRWFKRHLQKNVSIDAEPEDGHAAIEIEDLGATPFEQFAAHEIQAAVQSALQEIPEVFRSAVILRDLEGLSYEEIAEVLECSAGTVKSRILRGRRALKDLLEPLLVDRSAIAHENDRSAVVPIIDRSAIAHENDRSAVADAEDNSAAASENDRSAAAYSNVRANVGARFSASSSASRAASSRMPRPAFAPHFGPYRNTVSARTRFARESSASEELP
jgi:RNA polymerase sigma-70 factor (ECF subfamily)